MIHVYVLYIYSVLVLAQVFIIHEEISMSSTKSFDIPNLHEGYYISFEYKATEESGHWRGVISLSDKEGDSLFFLINKNEFYFQSCRRGPANSQNEQNLKNIWKRIVIYQQKFGDKYTYGITSDGSLLFDIPLERDAIETLKGVTLSLGANGHSLLSGFIREISIFGMETNYY